MNSNLKLNETPIRTSKNFNINNITLQNVPIPEHIENFENVTIINESSNIIINNSIKPYNLSYGLGSFLESQVKENANQTFNIIVNGKSNNELIIDFDFDEDNLNLIENIQITAAENAKATIILTYKTIENIQAYHNSILRVKAENNANLNIIVVNLLNNDSYNFISIENELKEKANVHFTMVDFGGKNSITNYYSNLIGEEANNSLDSIYLGAEKQLFDLNYIGELYGKKSNMNIEVQGALKDSATKHFKGTIDFKKGCKKAKGNENESCMLLSDTAKSMALPVLLCNEEDVEGNHATSSGKIGEKELFYIMSRGFELKEARKIMVKAKFNTILENIKNEELKEEIIEQIDKKLD